MLLIKVCRTGELRKYLKCNVCYSKLTNSTQMTINLSLNKHIDMGKSTNKWMMKSIHCSSQETRRLVTYYLVISSHKPSLLILQTFTLSKYTFFVGIMMVSRQYNLIYMGLAALLFKTPISSDYFLRTTSIIVSSFNERIFIMNYAWGIDPIQSTYC